MSDRVVTTSHQGYFSRVFKSFVGVLIGVLLVPGSLAFIGWNEYRTVHRTRGLLEAEKVVQVVNDPFEIQTTNNDKLIHLTGQATTSETLSDADFALSRVALRLSRDVEMYQWIENKETKTHEKMGGGRETITTYNYEKRWSNDRVRSEDFHESSGHSNPQLRYPSKSYTTKQATIGQYHMSPYQVDQIDAWQDVRLDANSLLAQLPESERPHFQVEGSQLFYSTDQPKPDAPQIGDLRIAFRVVKPQNVSILAQQNDDQLAAYRTSNGEVIERVVVGQQSAAAMFEMLRRENAVLAWILRGVGWILACVAFGLITGPLAALASVLPFLGRLTGMATFAVSLALGTAVALIAIGVAWLAVRPIWALALFGLAGLALYFLLRKRKRNNPQQPPIAVLA